jgi:hypothetical protein
MTKALNAAFEKAKQLSPAEQDELGETINQIVDRGI